MAIQNILQLNVSQSKLRYPVIFGAVKFKIMLAINGNIFATYNSITPVVKHMTVQKVTEKNLK